MTTETLSDKKHPSWKPHTDIKGWYLHEDVREFIKQLKEDFGTDPNEIWTTEYIIERIEKRAGKELVE